VPPVDVLPEPPCSSSQPPRRTRTSSRADAPIQRPGPGPGRSSGRCPVGGSGAGARYAGSGGAVGTPPTGVPQLVQNRPVPTGWPQLAQYAAGPSMVQKP